MHTQVTANFICASPRFCSGIVISIQGRWQKNFHGGQWKIQDQYIALIRLTLLFQGWFKERTRHIPRDHLKGTLHQEPREKRLPFCFGETPSLFGKIPTFLENFRSFSCTQVPTCPQSPLPINVNSTAKNQDSW